MSAENKEFKKGVIRIPKEKLLEYSKMSIISRFRWLEEANKFISAIKSGNKTK